MDCTAMPADSLVEYPLSLLPATANVHPAFSFSQRLASSMLHTAQRPLSIGNDLVTDSANLLLLSAVAPGGLFGGLQQTRRTKAISFDTSSKEPYLMRSRVFVGNIPANTISRDDIIGLFGAYGTLLGVTLFKGYAFVQYSKPEEADLSVTLLNGYKWKATVLDVKLAITRMKPQNVSSEVSSTYGIKRTLGDSQQNGNEKIKKVRGEECSSGDHCAQPQADNTAATECTQYTNLYETGMADILICGACRFVTSDFKQFRDHRMTPCTLPPAEEMALECAICEQKFTAVHAMLEHALKSHNIRVQKDRSQ